MPWAGPLFGHAVGSCGGGALPFWGGVVAGMI